MAKNIQDLRREAGYRSAKDFAEAMGIALSTYNRYENQPEAIPLKQAWAIADFLGCSIDMVVGREPVNAADMRGDVQKFYDGLSREGRELMDDHMDYIAHREKKARKRARKADRERYRLLLRQYTAQFDGEREGSEPFGIVVEYDSSDYRASFERFLEETAAARRDADAARHLEGLEEELRGGYIDAEGNARGLTEEEIEGQLAAEREAFVTEYAPRDREVIDGIMRAYDEREGGAGGGWRGSITRPE